jgi:hypothetical protein
MMQTTNVNHLRELRREGENCRTGLSGYHQPDPTTRDGQAGICSASGLESRVAAATNFADLTEYFG